jgi:hypothetical protein
MTFNLSDRGSTTRRCVAFLAKVALGIGHALRAGFAEPSSPSNPGRDAMSGRYFGLLVHMNGSDH